MAAQEDLYRNIVDNMHEGVYMLDRDRRITYWNKGAERLSGYNSEEVVGSGCAHNILIHTDDHGTLLCTNLCPAAMTLADGRTREENVVLHHKDGHRVPVWTKVLPIADAAGEIIGVVELFSENSARLAAVQRVEELDRALLLDSLTQLGNRNYLEMSLHARFAEKQRCRRDFGVLLIDIDHFKRVNEQYGPETGDRILKMVGATLANIARAYDIVGRWDSEQFLVIATTSTEDQLHLMADRARIYVRQSSLKVGSEMVWVTVSIGATLAQANDTPKKLVDRAEELMQQAKSTGRDRVTMDVHL